jgi:multisubunit Na+/H+ antiporter MnhE subunit
LVVRWVVWFVVLWWFWMLLVGEWNHFEWIAATAAAAVGASIFELMRSVTRADARVPAVWLKRAATVPWQMFVDFGIVTWAVVRSAATGRVVRGVFRAHEFEATGDSAADVGARAFADWAANFSPNALPVDVDREQGLSLVHDLVPNRSSEQPA